MSPNGSRTARVRILLHLTVRPFMNPCVVDGIVIAFGKGTHKYISRNVAADKALAILMEEEGS
jgi:hypothetical protein